MSSALQFRINGCFCCLQYCSPRRGSSRARSARQGAVPASSSRSITMAVTLSVGSSLKAAPAARRCRSILPHLPSRASARSCAPVHERKPLGPAETLQRCAVAKAAAADEPVKRNILFLGLLFTGWCAPLIPFRDRYSHPCGFHQCGVRVLGDSVQLTAALGLPGPLILPPVLVTCLGTAHGSWIHPCPGASRRPAPRKRT